jgi:hypothetical protein
MAVQTKPQIATPTEVETIATANRWLLALAPPLDFIRAQPTEVGTLNAVARCVQLIECANAAH